MMQVTDGVKQLRNFDAAVKAMAGRLAIDRKRGHSAFWLEVTRGRCSPQPDCYVIKYVDRLQQQ